jgi:hypothetical protein
VAGGWNPIPPAPLTGRLGASAAAGNAGFVFWGGIDAPPDGQPQPDGALYSYPKSAWEPIPPAPLAPRLGPALAVGDSSVLVWGGSGPADGALWDIDTGTWRHIAPAPLDERSGPVAAWDARRRRFLVWGGTAGRRGLLDGASYDPDADAWSRLPSLGRGSGRFTAFPLAGGVFAFEETGPGGSVSYIRADAGSGAAGRAATHASARICALFVSDADEWTTRDVPASLLDLPWHLPAGDGRVLSLAHDAAGFLWKPGLEAVEEVASPLEPGDAVDALAVTEAGAVVASAPAQTAAGPNRAWALRAGAWEPLGDISFAPPRRGLVLYAGARRVVAWGGFAATGAQGLELTSGAVLSV